ncbi:MAG: hypothetical protein JW860_00465 [Sedimentisphaerales bacterium]|nr:hypothetical protein [Sedimentisphaerales bacterium]
MMKAAMIMEQFYRIGARIKIRDGFSDRRLRIPRRYSIDIAVDRQGEYFDIWCWDHTLGFEAVDVRPEERALLLVIGGREDDQCGYSRQVFLCGYDQGHWFIEQVGSRCRSIEQARACLKPAGMLC